MPFITIRPRGEPQPVSLNTRDIIRMSIGTNGLTLIHTPDHTYEVSEHQRDLQERLNKLDTGHIASAQG